MRRGRWPVRPPVIAAAALTAVAGAFAAVAVNAATGSPPPWLGAMGYHPGWWLIVSTIAVAVASVLATWVQGRPHDAADSALAGGEIESVAVQLAGGVSRQLRAEDQLQLVFDPWPMPVRLKAADRHLMDHWRAVRGDPGNDTPVPLQAEVTSIVDMFVDIPSHRLVLLGPGGAGKTVAARRLATDLAELYQPGDPVPFLARLSAWNLGRQQLADWLEQRILEDHPGLAGRRAQVHELVQTGRILPILDGLDEIAVPHQPLALRCINQWLAPGQPVVLTCRNDEFAAAVERADVVSGAAVAELLPLDEDAAFDYLVAATPPSAAERWEKVQTTAVAGPLRQVLRSPLNLAMARTVYSAARALDDVEENRLPADRAAIERELMGGYVERALDQLTGEGGSEAARSRRRLRARRWLQHLADWSVNGDGDIAWWEASRLLSRAAVSVTFATITGVLAGLLWAAFNFAFNPNSGVLVGAAIVTVAAATVSGCVFCPTAAPKRARAAPRHPVPTPFAAVLVLSLTAAAAAGSPVAAFRHVLDLASAAFLASWIASPSWLLALVRRTAPPPTVEHAQRRARWRSAALALTAGVLVYAAAVLDGFGPLRSCAHIAVVVTASVGLVASAFGGAMLATPGPGHERHRLRYRLGATSAAGLGAVFVIWVYLSPADHSVAVVDWLVSPAARVPALVMLTGFPIMVGRYLAQVASRTDRRPHRIVPSWGNLAPVVVPRVLAGAFLGYLTVSVIFDLVRGFFPQLGFDYPYALVACQDDASAISLWDGRSVWLGAFLGAAIGMAIGIGTWSRTPTDRMQLLSPRAVLRADRAVAVVGLVLPAALGIAVMNHPMCTGLDERDAFRGWSTWFSDRGFSQLARLVHSVPDVAPVNVASMLLVLAAPALLMISLPVAMTMLRRLAWPQYQVARTLMAIRGRTPWRLFRFLARAHQAGLLRQAGGVYQFRHVRLAEYLQQEPAAFGAS